MKQTRFRARPITIRIRRQAPSPLARQGRDGSVRREFRSNSNGISNSNNDNATTTTTNDKT